MSSGELRATLQKHLGVYRDLPLAEIDNQSHDVVIARRRVMRLAFDLYQSIGSFVELLGPFALTYNAARNVADDEIPQVIAVVNSGEPSGAAADVMATSTLMKNAVDEGANLVNAISEEVPALEGIANILAGLYGLSAADGIQPDTYNAELVNAAYDGSHIQPKAVTTLEAYTENL